MKDDFFGNYRKSVEGKRVNRNSDFVQGWWENISREPVYIKDKYHLKQVCEAESKRTGRLIIPRIFAKPKSQGQGLEWTF